MNRTPTAEEIAEEIIEAHLAGELRKEGPQTRRGKRLRRRPNTTIISEVAKRLARQREQQSTKTS